MKKFLCIIGLLPIAAFGQQFRLEQPLHVNNNGFPSVAGINVHGTNQVAPYYRAGNGTNTIFAVNADGSLYLNATTNQVTFGATNIAPVNTSNVVGWVSVQVSGNTNLYRLPLYK